MVTKGLDMPDVSLVGVLSADAGAELPDFRAAEKTFARLLQVAGRSGRGEKQGEVLIQTYAPESPYIVDAARQEYETFFDREIESRRDGEYPPFTRLINLTLAAPDEEKLEKTAQQFAVELRNESKRGGLAASVLGPAPCPIYHLKRMYRRHLLVKTRQTSRFVQMLTQWEQKEPRFRLPSTVRLTVDVDPIDMM
jgi:primosomal protein N' (replication factor Y)